jgi:hypothetical protein
VTVGALTLRSHLAAPSYRVAQVGDIKAIGFANNTDGPLVFEGLQPVVNRMSMGKGTRYFAFRLPTGSPQPVPYKPFHQSKVRAALLSSTGDLFPLDVWPIADSPGAGYVVLNPAWTAVIDRYLLRVECAGKATSTFELHSEPRSPAFAPGDGPTELEAAGIKIEGRGVAWSGRDGVHYPRVGATVRLTGRRDKANDYEWHNLEIFTPYDSYSGGSISTFATHLAICNTKTSPFASEIKAVKATGELWVFPHDPADQKTGTRLHKSPPPKRIPFSLILPIERFAKETPSPILYASAATENFWPETSKMVVPVHRE